MVGEGILIPGSAGEPTEGGGSHNLAWFLPAGLWTAMILTLSATASIQQPAAIESLPEVDKLEHVIEYGILALLLTLGAIRGLHTPPELRPLLPLLGIIVLIAASDELVQTLNPARNSDLFDGIADVVGGFLGIVLSPYLWPRLLTTEERADA